MNTKFIAFSTAAAVGLAAFAGAASARDQVKVAGSSTVLPYANIVAEQFGKTFSNFKTPVIESGGSSAGLKQFCAGVGEDKIDVANSSRKIKPAEQEECAKNGVTDIVEVKFGYDGIVFAVDTARWRLEDRAQGSLSRSRCRGSEGRRSRRQPEQDLERSQRRASPIRRSPLSSPARSTARAKSSKRRFCTLAARPRAATSSRSPRLKARTTKPRRKLPTRPA